MTQIERRQRGAMALLIATRERNDDAMRDLEMDRSRLMDQGGLISSPLWRRQIPKEMAPAASRQFLG